MRKICKKTKYNKIKNSLIKNDGSAMMLSMIVMVVLMLLTTLLLISAYSLYHTCVTGIKNDQVREYVQSLSQSIEENLTVNYASLDEEEADTSNELYRYIKNNIWQTGLGSWTYYNEDEWGHDKDNAYRYFDLKLDDEADKNVKVRMSWESEAGVYDKNGTYLQVDISCIDGDESYRLVSNYELTTSYYDSLKTQEKWNWTMVGRE